QQVSTNATSFEALTSLARDGFFTRGAAQRTCVLVTDGESRSYSAADVVGALQGARGCRLLVVRVGGNDERVFGADGSPEAGDSADPAAADRTRARAGPPRPEPGPAPRQPVGSPSRRRMRLPRPRRCGERRRSARPAGSRRR